MHRLHFLFIHVGKDVCCTLSFHYLFSHIFDVSLLFVCLSVLLLVIFTVISIFVWTHNL